MLHQVCTKATATLQSDGMAYFSYSFSRMTASVVSVLAGQFANKPTRGESSRVLDNSRTGQLADSEFLKIIELLGASELVTR